MNREDKNLKGVLFFCCSVGRNAILEFFFFRIRTIALESRRAVVLISRESIRTRWLRRTAVKEKQKWLCFICTRDWQLGLLWNWSALDFTVFFYCDCHYVYELRFIDYNVRWLLEMRALIKYRNHKVILTRERAVWKREREREEKNMASDK